MIAKMKKVFVVSSASQKEKMLDGLRDLGILHLSEKKTAAHEAVERVLSLSRTQAALVDYAPDKKEKKKKAYQEPNVLSDQAFESMFERAKASLERKTALGIEIQSAGNEIERIKPWGSFSPKDIKDLKTDGFDLHFYRLGKPEFDIVSQDPDIKMIRLADVDKMYTIATIGPLPGNIPSNEFNIPEKGIEELNKDIDDCTKEIIHCEEFLTKAAKYDSSFNVQILKAQNEEEYSSANKSVEGEGGLVWLSGYIPEDDVESFKASAAGNGWAYAISDVEDDDQQIPTKVKYGKVSGLIKPVFDILGILPGYRESDVSFYFFLFFTLFFAMIMGDGGYGMLLLLATIVITVKLKKKNNIIFLLFVLSFATIAWGAVTGTWFGLESAMEIPFLKAMVVPGIATYPEYFGVSTALSQNNIIKFSFSIGAVQMALGSIISIRKKLVEKNLSWIADLGWLIAVIAMYMLSLLLVVNEPLNIMPIFAMIGAAFILVVVFGGMSPDKTFGQGLKAGLADAFTVFLNTISCFGNVMSYIRLFAVGMAGVAISQSFNELGGGFSGPLLIAGIVIVIIGHALNLIMCVLSVVVHGVRLNVLEFSGQAGVEWSGIPYEPFKVNSKIKK